MGTFLLSVISTGTGVSVGSDGSVGVCRWRNGWLDRFVWEELLLAKATLFVWELQAQKTILTWSS